MTTPKTPRRSNKAQSSSAWLTGSTLVLRAVRAVCDTKRTVVLDLERPGHRGEIAFSRGEVVGAKVGRLVGQDAFNHLLMWSDAGFKVRVVTVPPTINVRTEALIDAGLAHMSALDGVAEVLGGPRATFERRDARLRDPALKLPAAVRTFATHIEDGARLADLVEASTFSPGDTLKICHRLCELEVLVMSEPTDQGPSVPAQIAALDWMLAAKPASPKRPRRDPTSEQTTRQPKTGTARSSRITKSSRKIPRSELSFDEVDRAFFERDAPIEQTDRFEDLENTSTRYKLSRKRR